MRQVRERHATATIFAGNVVTGEMVEELILTGADAIKIGIGPGSVCTTRRQTGVGYPQLSAIIECKTFFFSSSTTYHYLWYHCYYFFSII